MGLWGFIVGGGIHVGWGAIGVAHQPFVQLVDAFLDHACGGGLFDGHAEVGDEVAFELFQFSPGVIG